MRRTLAALALAAPLLLAGPAGRTADEKKPAEPPKAAAEPAEHDFGKKVLVVTTRPAPDAGGGVLEKARVRKLGNRWFVVGQPVNMSDDRRPTPAAVWIPLSEVVQMSEFESVAEVKRFADRR